MERRTTARRFECKKSGRGVFFGCSGRFFLKKMKQKCKKVYRLLVKNMRYRRKTNKMAQAACRKDMLLFFGCQKYLDGIFLNCHKRDKLISAGSPFPMNEICSAYQDASTPPLRSLQKEVLDTMSVTGVSKLRPISSPLQSLARTFFLFSNKSNKHNKSTSTGSIQKGLAIPIRSTAPSAKAAFIPLTKRLKTKTRFSRFEPFAF